MRPGLADVTWAVSDGDGRRITRFSSALEKRLTHGLSGLLSYTWGHSIDTVGQSFGGGADGPLPQDPRNRLQPIAGNSPFDIRHRLTVAWNYPLPFGEGRRWLNGGGAAATVLGGWQVNGINIFQTGLPFTPTLNAATVNTGTGSRPDRIGDGTLADPTVDRWFDVTAFTTPPQFTYGNAGRNILYGPGRMNFDFSLFKEFRGSASGCSLQFRAGGVQLSSIRRSSTCPTRPSAQANAGTITGIVGTPRQIQFGLKAIF